MNNFSTIYRGYKIENSAYFNGIFRITRPSGKFLTLSSRLVYALGYIDQDIKALIQSKR